MQALLAKLPQLVSAEAYSQVARLEKRLNQPNVPADLASVLARLEFAVPLMDIIEIGEGSALSLDDVAANYLQLGRDLQLDWLRAAITQLPRDNRWQSLARSALRDDLYRQHRSLTQSAMAVSQDADFVPQWLKQRATDVEACQQMFAELQSFEALDLAMLSAGMRELNNHLLA